jgi:hypothetical protein
VALDGSASQNSAVSPDGISAVRNTASGVAIDIVEVNAQSTLAITCELAADTLYSLSGSLDIGVGADARDPAGSATVRLSGPGGPIPALSLTSTGVTNSQGFSHAGVLTAGVYTAFAQAVQGPSSDGLTSAFELSFALPEPSAWLLLGASLLLPSLVRRV